MKHWQKNIQIDESNTIQSTETDEQKYGYWYLKNRTKTSQWERRVFLVNGAGKIEHLHAKQWI